MEALFDSGKTRVIGVNNFSIKKIGDLLEVVRVPPAVNRVECHPAWQQQNLCTFCNSKGVNLTGYSPLGSPGTGLVKSDILKNLIINMVVESICFEVFVLISMPRGYRLIRPRLLDFVSSLDEYVVKSASKKGFKSLPDLSKAISELTVLKGVGPATTSAVLAADAPDVASFMSDEAMVAALGNAKDYTLKQYLLFANKLQAKAKAWFRELPTGILDPLSPEQVMQCETEEDCVVLVRLLPPTETALLDWAVNLMADVVQQEHANKMNAHKDIGVSIISK